MIHAENADGSPAIEREIVLSRVYDAPRERVFDMWTQKEHVTRWFGPKGFSTTTHEMDARVGGMWRFQLRGPDGRYWDSRIVYLEVKRPEKLVYDHGSDRDDDPHRFRVTITFEEQSDKKTVVTMRQLHPSKAQRDAGIGFGAVELGYQTLDKLGEHLRSTLDA
jgi:uncharacterized protein YndB with AHSA1/START domain